MISRPSPHGFDKSRRLLNISDLFSLVGWCSLLPNSDSDADASLSRSPTREEPVVEFVFMIYSVSIGEHYMSRKPGKPLAKSALLLT
ncbi:hypothetical protein Y026_4643 [Burkholderia pseudomallei TSV28]|nr:hypothetical protein Y026_4643 [Burkholderia pseudomallei TSV28]